MSRKAQTRTRTGEHRERDAQFQKIAELKAPYLSDGNPVMSIDTKKKELIGNFYREGRLYTQETVLTFDHDFPSLARGVVMPYGIYDVTYNQGYVALGTSHDTSEFACDSLRNGWWLYAYRSGKFGVKSQIALSSRDERAT
jgi:hypothetical protein